MLNIYITLMMLKFNKELHGSFTNSNEFILLKMFFILYLTHGDEIKRFRINEDLDFLLFGIDF
jgi:hypothetical protein